MSPVSTLHDDTRSVQNSVKDIVGAFDIHKAMGMSSVLTPQHQQNSKLKSEILCLLKMVEREANLQSECKQINKVLKMVDAFTKEYLKAYFQTLLETLRTKSQNIKGQIIIVLSLLKKHDIPLSPAMSSGS